MLPLCGDPHAHQMLEELHSFAYPPFASAPDYEAARAGRAGGYKPRVEAVLRKRHGSLPGLLRAVRMKAVLVALATR